MREKQIEMKLVEAVRKRGGLCPKFISTGFAGVPDRIVLLPGGHMAFAELKTPGGKPRPLQVVRGEQLRALGFRVYVIDRIDQIGGMLDEISSSF